MIFKSNESIPEKSLKRNVKIINSLLGSPVILYCPFSWAKWTHKHWILQYRHLVINSLLYNLTSLYIPDVNLDLFGLFQCSSGDLVVSFYLEVYGENYSHDNIDNNNTFYGIHEIFNSFLSVNFNFMCSLNSLNRHIMLCATRNIKS